MPSTNENSVKKRNDGGDPPFDKSFFTWSGMDKLSKASVDRLSSFVFNREAYGSELCAFFHKLIIYHQKWSAFNEEQKKQRVVTEKPEETKNNSKRHSRYSVTVAKRFAKESESKKGDAIPKVLPDLKLEEEQDSPYAINALEDIAPTAAVFNSPPPPDPSLGWPHMKKPKVEEVEEPWIDDDKEFDKMVASMEPPQRIHGSDLLQYQQSIRRSFEDERNAHVSMIFGERPGFSQTIAQIPPVGMRRPSADYGLYDTIGTSHPANVQLRMPDPPLSVLPVLPQLPSSSIWPRVGFARDARASPPPFMPAFSLRNPPSPTAFPTSFSALRSPSKDRVHHSDARPNYNGPRAEEDKERRCASTTTDFDDLRCDHCVRRTNACEKCYRSALLKREKARIQAQLEWNAQKSKRDSSSPSRDDYRNRRKRKY